MSKREPYSFPRPDAEPMWTSLEAKADPEAFQAHASAEFPHGFAEQRETGPLHLGRRGFLHSLGTLGAAAGLSGCIRRPEEKILPFARQPEYAIPGIALHYATAVRCAGDALGLLVTCHEGRPTKVEGNSAHPTSEGATSGYAQASILDLYDPDRSPAPARASAGGLQSTSFDEVDRMLSEVAREADKDAGERLRVLMTPCASPTLKRVCDVFAQRFPRARVYQYEPIARDHVRSGFQLAYGRPANVVYDFRQARIVVSLDCDFLGTEPGATRAAHDFAMWRRPQHGRDTISRLYAVEPGFTLTGANADHRLRLPAHAIGAYLKALGAALVRRGVLRDRMPSGSKVESFAPLRAALDGATAPPGVSADWIETLAEELSASGENGRALIAVGSRQPPAVHALAFALNDVLGGIGRTVQALTPLDANAQSGVPAMTALCQELEGGRVDTLLMLGGNPVFDAPSDLQFADLLMKVRTSVHLSEYRDETSALATWHVPRAHAFESWGDVRSESGHYAVQQPLIAPLYGGRSDAELLAHLAGIRYWRGYPLVRATARTILAGDFEASWKATLHLGLARDLPSAFITESALDVARVAALLPSIAGPELLSPERLEVNFAPDPALYDGRYANNPWMLELPDPISCISWDNAAYLCPDTARALNLQSGDLVRVHAPHGAAVAVVAWILPGLADHCVSLHLGWGRTRAGRYGNGVGANVYPLRTRDRLGFGTGYRIEKVGVRYPVAQTQETHSMEGRPIALDATLTGFHQREQFAKFRSPTPSTLPLWKEVEYRGHRWSMVIDLSTCTGCNACLIACQAENSVPTVGKEQVARGRDMYWLRLDRYFVGDDVQSPRVAFQPVGCQHCEEAPCENVCPVNATAHSPEGLNDMAYNRCIGTRYCMNNCPYKVRRFNFLDFTGQVPETRRMQYNPNVSVRMRGVMEKCSYCVQRIQEAKIAARRNDDPLRDGQIRTACEQVCPARAITFGDLNDSQSRVSRLTKLNRQYKLLPEIGTQPRTSYLAKIRNPNPKFHS